MGGSCWGAPGWDRPGWLPEDFAQDATESRLGLGGAVTSRATTPKSPGCCESSSSSLVLLGCVWDGTGEAAGPGCCREYFPTVSQLGGPESQPKGGHLHARRAWSSWHETGVKALPCACLGLCKPKAVQHTSRERWLDKQQPSKLCTDVKNMNVCSGSLLSGVTAEYWFYSCLQIIVPRAIGVWDLPSPRLGEATAWWPLSAQEGTWQGAGFCREGSS